MLLLDLVMRMVKHKSDFQKGYNLEHSINKIIRNSNSKTEVQGIQYHPPNWPKSDLTTSDGKVCSSDYMYDFIEYLISENVIFMTANEYLDYASVLH